LALASVIGYVAWRTRRIPTPQRKWRRFDHPAAEPLDASICNALEGIYTIEKGNDHFGETAVLKYSYTVEKGEKIHHLSLFCENNGVYILSEGKQRGNDILVKGHWRRASSNGTGLVWLNIKNGIRLAKTERGKAVLKIRGAFSNDNHRPHQPLFFSFQEPLPKVPPIDILAHRGGARNVDFLSISENTTGMVKLAAQLGANGIEIDVRMTKDGVPVIFHDSFFSIHTVQDVIYGGLLHDHTLAQVKQLELRNEGVVPTLEEMLHTVLYETPLEVVWLDIKKECDLVMVHRLQKEYHQRAAAIGRKLHILIGIPDNYVLKCFKELEDFKEIPCLTELSYDMAFELNAQVWAPQYTGGFRSEEVGKIHEAGKKAYVWSLDAEFMVEAYITEGGFDGLVTNTAPVVAHWFYTKHKKARSKNKKPVVATLVLFIAALLPTL
jgi:glycerophosphoryl diester phosphodiesterase